MPSNRKIGPSLSIAHLSSPQVDRAGDYLYRVEQPNRALASLPGIRVVELTTLSRHRQKLLSEADVLIINLIGDPDLLPVIHERRQAGKLTVYEINDYFLGFQPWNPVYYFFKDPENRSCILQLIEQCDAVQVTCRELAERFARYNSNIIVFENQMVRVGFLEKAETPLVIGWGGSHGHLEDLRNAVPHLIGWFKKHREVKLSLMGSKEIYDLFHELEPSQKIYTPPGSLEDFYRFLQTLHVGLAPLLPTDYNLCRSDVKFLEYGAFGAVPVCADLEPYRHLENEETGLLFRTPEEIPSLLDRLLNDPAWRNKIAAGAHHYVTTQRMENTHTAERIEFYRKELEGISGRQAPTTVPSLSWVKNLPEAENTPDTEYTRLRFTTVEENLYNGLVHQFQHHQTEEAIQCFKKAKTTGAPFYLPDLYLGNACEATDTEEAEAAYRRALDQNPSSCFTAVLLAQVLQKRGKNAEALEYFRRTVEIAPDFARPWLHLGLAAQQEARGEDKTLQSFQKALEANPYYSPAYTHLGMFLVHQNRKVDAKKAFECALALQPDSVADNFYLGNLLLEEGNLEGAEDLYKRSLSLQPKLAAAHVNLSRIYQVQGKQEEAQRARKEALRLQPDLAGRI